MSDFTPLLVDSIRRLRLYSLLITSLVFLCCFGQLALISRTPRQYGHVIKEVDPRRRRRRRTNTEVPRAARNGTDRPPDRRSHQGNYRTKLVPAGHAVKAWIGVDWGNVRLIGFQWSKVLPFRWSATDANTMKYLTETRRKKWPNATFMFTIGPLRLLCWTRSARWHSGALTNARWPTAGEKLQAQNYKNEFISNNL